MVDRDQSTERTGFVPVRVAILAGVLLEGAGLTVFLWFFFTRGSVVVASVTQVIAPGSGSVMFYEQGPHAIFHEYRSDVEGRQIDSEPEQIDALNITLTSQVTGDPYVITPVTDGTSYSVHGREGYALYTFDVTELGPAMLVAEAKDPGAPPGELVLAAGRYFEPSTTMFVIVGIVTLGLPSVVSSIIILTAGFTRRRA